MPTYPIGNFSTHKKETYRPSPQRTVTIPDSKITFEITQQGIIAIYDNGNRQRVWGDEIVGSGAHFSLLIPGRNEILLYADNGYFLLIDQETSGDQVCEKRLATQPSPSSVCLRSIRDAGRPIEWINAWTPDPNGDRLLVAAHGGLLYLEGTQLRSDPRPELRHVAGFAQIPWQRALYIFTATGTYIFDSQGQMTEVTDEPSSRGGSLREVETFESIRTILAARGAYSFYLLGGDGPVPILSSKGSTFSPINAAVSAPWLSDRPVAATREGLKLVNSDGTLEDLVPWSFGFGQLGRLDGQNYARSMFPIDRTQTILLGNLSARRWYRTSPDMALEEVDLARSEVLDVEDPGEGDVLIGTTTGLYGLSADGLTHHVKPADGFDTRAVRVIKWSSALQSFLVGSEGGLYRFTSNELRAYPGGAGNIVGAIYQIVDVPWARLTFIRAATGIYSIGVDGVLRMAAAQRGFGRKVFLEAFPELQRVFVRSGDRPDQVFELLRSDLRRQTVCNRPL